MDEHTLIRAFDRAVRDEPALGFDPDDVVTTAGRLQRRRRAAMLAASGVAAIAVAAVAVPLAIGHTSIGAPVHAAGLATTPQQPAPDVEKAAPGQWPPTTLHFPTLSNARLTSELAVGKHHLAAVLPSVVPGATSLVFDPPRKPGEADGFVGRFYSVPVGTKDPNTGIVTDRDTVTRQGYSTPGLTFHAGGRTLNVGVSVELPIGTIQPGPVPTECFAMASCLVHDEPDGSVQVVDDDRRQGVLDVEVFRADGTVVRASADALGAPANDVMLTEDQLLRLALDPAFALTP